MLRFKPHDPELAWRRDPFEDAWRGIHNPFVCHFGTSTNTVTETKNNDPWKPQQPYLTGGFKFAGDLLNGPAPTQTNTVVPMNGAQTSALDQIIQKAGGQTGIPQNATDFANKLLSGGFFGANPAQGYFSSMAGQNLGVTGPGAGTLSDIAAGGGAGSDTLKNFAAGDYVSNSYSDDAAKSVMANVVPQITSMFNRGNSINNPAAARAAAEGATAALAPLEFQQQMNARNQQMSAAQQMNANQAGAAQAQQSGAIAGAGVQGQAAQGLSNSFQDTLAKMVQGSALAPGTQALSYADLDKMFQAGGAYQTQAQNVASASDASANFAQLSPYQQLQAYMSAVTGNYGGTSTDTKPYFQNRTADTLGTIGSAASMASMLIPFL